jgi:hypothetical protein
MRSAAVEPAHLLCIAMRAKRLRASSRGATRLSAASSFKVNTGGSP